MKKFYGTLSHLRFFLAGAVLLLFSYFYVRGTGESEGGRELFAALLNMQVSASALRRGLAEETVLFFFVAALVFGRVFCSVLCPMGTLQEIFWRSSKFLRPKRGTAYVKPWAARYAVPLVVAIGVAFALPPPILLLDPISNFGRGIGTIVHGGLSGVSPVVRLSLATFAAILAFALLRGRRFCDWCPVGIALGCAARVAPFGIVMDRHACVGCGMCEKKCPTNCVDSSGKKIDRDRCVLCFSCAAVCPNGSMRYGAAFQANRTRETRRAFGRRALGSLAGLALGLLCFGGRNVRNAAASGEGAQPGFIGRILPPGAIDTSNYFSRCVGCRACVAACPVGIVRVSDSPHPQLDYGENYCQYNCTACGEVCPTAAIRHLARDEKRRTRVAATELHLDRCVVVTNRQACGACAEVCPTRALVMEPYGGAGSGLTIPVFDERYCIGCGACLISCPAEPRAFTIKGLAVQTRTEGIRPTSDAEGLPPLPTLPGETDFPF